MEQLTRSAYFKPTVTDSILLIFRCIILETKSAKHIQMSSSALRFLSLNALKNVGVSPVIFLNWFDR